MEREGEEGVGGGAAYSVLTWGLVLAGQAPAGRVVRTERTELLAAEA